MVPEDFISQSLLKLDGSTLLRVGNEEVGGRFYLCTNFICILVEKERRTEQKREKFAGFRTSSSAT